MEKWTSVNAMENGFGLSWLGNIVINSGIGTVDTGKSTDIHCRGRISYMDNFHGQLVIETETAWEPMLELWEKLLGRYLPKSVVHYDATEPGCEICQTNNPDYIGKYHIDSINEDVETDYEADSETVKKTIQELLHSSEENLYALLKLLYKSPIDGISINKWEYRPFIMQRGEAG